MIPKRPRVVIQGNLIKGLNMAPSSGNPNPPLRGTVKGFSAASRRRMIEQCAKMGKAVPIFVTLTYGADYPEDPAIWKKHLEYWGKRLVRYDSSLSAIWRLEPQKRGAPHYHLLVYAADGKRPFLPHDWVAKSWSEVLGEYSNDEHLKAGTRVEALRSCRGAAFYAAKYCAKLPEDDDFPPEWDAAGRLWGSFNKKRLPIAKQFEMVLHSEQEQMAVLFLMKDLYKNSFIESKAKALEAEGCPPEESRTVALSEWKSICEENEHFGNTTKSFFDARRFMEYLPGKLFEIELNLSRRLNRDPRANVISDFQCRVDKAMSHL